MNNTLALAVAFSGVAMAASAEAVPPADVPFGEYGEVETSLTGQPGSAERGLTIMVERGKGNCIACHEVEVLGDFPFHGEVGPMLDGAGSRWSEAELRGIVADAKHTFEATMMPSFYKNTGYIRPGAAFTGKAADEPLEPLLTAQEVEDVVAYLMTLTDS